MSPSTEYVSDKERSTKTLINLIQINDELSFENRHLSDSNLALFSQVQELTEMFSLSEMADLLMEFGYLPSDMTPLTVAIYNFCLDQDDWWENRVLTAVGGEYMRVIDDGVVLTHKGRALVFDSFFK